MERTCPTTADIRPIRCGTGTFLATSAPSAISKYGLGAPENTDICTRSMSGGMNESRMTPDLRRDPLGKQDHLIDAVAADAGVDHRNAELGFEIGRQLSSASTSLP